MNVQNNVYDLLNSLSDEVNQLYGYVKISDNNFGEPAINSGSCGPFANAFFAQDTLYFKLRILISQ